MDANPKGEELAERRWQANFGPDREISILPHFKFNKSKTQGTQTKSAIETSRTFDQISEISRQRRSVLNKQTENSRRSSSDLEDQLKVEYPKKSQRSRPNPLEGLPSFDGVGDNNYSNWHGNQIHHHNMTKAYHSPNNSMMDGHESNVHRSPSKPKPLNIYKQQESQPRSNGYSQEPPTIAYPPRISSICNRYANDAEILHDSPARAATVVDNPNSTVSDYPDVFEPFRQDSTAATSAPYLIIPNYHLKQYLSSSESSAILGDFIPIAPPNMTPVVREMAQRNKPFGAYA